MNKIQKTYMEAELKEQEIKIYRLVKNDIQYIIKEMGNNNYSNAEIKSILQTYVNCIDSKLKSIEEGGK